MGTLSKKLRNVAQVVPRRYAIAHWCPGCKEAHVIWTENASRPQWDWDGNVDAPTVSPSVRIFHPAHVDEEGVQIPEETLCHYFLRNGNIDFCGDSAHDLKGQIVPLPDFPAHWGGFDD